MTLNSRVPGRVQGRHRDLLSRMSVQSVPRPYRRSEQTVDRYLHLASLAAGAVGSVALVSSAAARESGLMPASVVVYGIGLIGMISASALYNSASSARWREWFRRF